MNLGVQDEWQALIRDFWIYINKRCGCILTNISTSKQAIKEQICVRSCFYRSFTITGNHMVTSKLCKHNYWSAPHINQKHFLIENLVRWHEIWWVAYFLFNQCLMPNNPEYYSHTPFLFRCVFPILHMCLIHDTYVRCWVAEDRHIRGLLQRQTLKPWYRYQSHKKKCQCGNKISKMWAVGSKFCDIDNIHMH